MESHPRISELLVKTGAYRDLDEPVILTSGELGIYYINAEKLCQDDGEFKKYGDDSRGMIGHAIRMTQEHPTFKEVIDILSEKAGQILRDYEPILISGGQRRDWLFSGPVAHQLDIPHVSIYKNGTIEILGPDGGPFFPFAFDEALDLHISDLLTEGSSCYRTVDKEEKGWVPTLWQTKAVIGNLLAVVTRLQGGEERLVEQGVNVESFVAIDEDFLKQHSEHPERALSYIQSPKNWSENYLKENGALALIENFNPESKKLDRAKEFLDRYGSVLKEAGKLEELKNAVQKKYNKPLDELVRGTK